MLNAALLALRSSKMNVTIAVIFYITLFRSIRRKSAVISVAINTMLNNGGKFNADWHTKMPNQLVFHH